VAELQNETALVCRTMLQLRASSAAA
jgi:hypothetical protein